jgi:hypothetical protein
MKAGKSAIVRPIFTMVLQAAIRAAFDAAPAERELAAIEAEVEVDPC